MQFLLQRRVSISLLLAAMCICIAPAYTQITFPVPSHPPAGNITRLEYFFDADPGFGNAIAIPVAVQTDVAVLQTIPVSGLSAGVHRFSIRALDGNGVWGQSSMLNFYVIPVLQLIAHPAPVNIVKAEYFIDTDPGFGNGTNIPVTAGQDVTTSGVAINTNALSAGIHQVYVRIKDAQGSWSLSNVNFLYIIPSLNIKPHLPVANIVKAEYYVDTDPGFGNANDIPVTAGMDVTVSNFAALLGNLSSGVHNVFIRVKDANGNWGLSSGQRISVVTANISVPQASAPEQITSLEYFFDTDPGFGNGTAVNIPAGTTDLQNFQFAADISSLTDGNHTLFIRSKGNWSVTNAVTFNIGQSTLPVKLIHFGASKEQETVLLQWRTTNEKDNSYFEVQRSLNALTFTSIGSVKAAEDAETEHRYEFKDEHPFNGISHYRLKQVDEGGTFTYSPVISIRMNGDAGGFTVGNPAHNVLYISSATANMIFRVSDISGRVLLVHKSSGASREEINISTLPAGEYFVSGSNGSEQQYRRFTKN